ncbi:hypothetical protein CPC16_006511 [Podila verticillata]|nr:hypothetical protein BGZ52_002214 [Haplosporangium bisporale]KAF9216446.1 hypothetical protein BGZ59_009646 [Podila verticillata]KAF9388419.1 hypothetical protein CPC16_006511 [Podila verticillata]KFH72509.1 hypothetical protein MVEG_02799 [Podila verticillata NRRL 6337]
MNMFNTDSGFRPPSPLSFAPSGQGLFGEPLGYDEFRFNGQDFINLPTSPPPMDPSMSLFNPSEQRYFSEFLDTLVVDQDFTFDPSSIPNLPNLPLFSPDTMPGSLLENPFMNPSSMATPNLMGSLGTSMDFDLTSPSSQTSFSGPLPNHYGRGGFPSPQGESPKSPGSPGHHTSSGPVSAPSKRNKSNKGTVNIPSRKGTPRIDTQDSRMATPIQQLSKLSLNGPSNPKKNKREDDDHKDDDSQERNTSVSDGSVSDSGVSSGPNSSTPSTTKRKPYKELLTEEEKRANHIASEQKRRNTIRNGFKDMTELIPDLKDLNSSKSTILFKAVDFIKHLENRNRNLQEKASRLESRLMSQRGSESSSPERLQDIPHIYPVSCSR